MSNKNTSPAARPDEENPEWTVQDFACARPALTVVAEAFRPDAAETPKRGRGRGRPPKTTRKVNQTLRLDPDVLEAYRTEGNGWQAGINEILCQNMPRSGK